MEYNALAGLTERECESVVCFQLVQNTVQRWTPANTATEFLCPQNSENSWPIQLHSDSQEEVSSMELLNDCILKHETAKLLRNFCGCSGVKLSNMFI